VAPLDSTPPTGAWKKEIATLREDRAPQPRIPPRAADVPLMYVAPITRRNSAYVRLLLP
jgi:hypothetical protein